MSGNEFERKPGDKDRDKRERERERDKRSVIELRIVKRVLPSKEVYDYFRCCKMNSLFKRSMIYAD